MNRNSFYGKNENQNDSEKDNLYTNIKIINNSLNEKEKEIKELKIELDKKSDIIHDLNQQIQNKVIEINNLKEQINILNNDDLVTVVNPGEKVIATLFHSSDQKIDFSIACKNTTPFVQLEEKLYEEYPEYKETDNYFLYNGGKLRRFKTIEENQIKSGKPIILYVNN